MKQRSCIKWFSLLLAFAVGSCSHQGATNKRLLREAVEQGDLGAIRTIVSKNRDLLLEKFGPFEETLFHLAARANQADATNELIKFGANPDLPRSDGRRPLHVAAEKGHDKVVDVLLKTPAEIDSRNNDLFTPLQLASFQGNGQIVKMLVDAGANKEYCIHHGTALHWAIVGGQRETANTLINMGADVEAKNPEGATPVQMALMTDKIEIALLLIGGSSPESVGYREGYLRSAWSPFSVPGSRTVGSRRL